MKTKSILLLVTLIGFMFFLSCKKDNTSDTLPFSPLTVEQNKAAIEDDGLAMLNSVKAMEALPTIDATTNMMNYVTTGDLFGANTNISTPAKGYLFNELLKPVKIASNLKGFKANRVADQLKVTFDPQTLVELWNGVKGTYSWNATNQNWDWVTGNDIVIRFPSTETGTTNNVVFSVHDFQYETGPFNWTGTYTGELPKQIISDLKVDGTALLIYTLNITYLNTDKKPNSISTSLELPPFKFAFDATNNNDASASVSFKWTNSATTLLALSLSATGNWSETNLSNQNLEPGDVFTTGNASFQLMNIKLAGNVDVKNLNNDINNISPTLRDSLRAAKQCEVITKNAKLYVCYADNNLVIANVVVYPVEKTDTYWDYVYNPNTQNWVWTEITETYWEPTPKLVFADATSADIETYFGTGFTDLQTAIEDYLNQLQATYGK